MKAVNGWGSTSLIEQLACPVDRTSLRRVDNGLRCKNGHLFPVVQGIPVLLPPHIEPTQPGVVREAIKSAGGESDFAFTDHVAAVAGATCGRLYEGHSRFDSIDDLPWPRWRMPRAASGLMVDIGCNWGRWSIPAARRGYRVIGIDPNLRALLAADAIAREEGLDNVAFVAGDARCLPLKTACSDYVFSYSVLQHLERSDAVESFREIGRIVGSRGSAMVQMANRFGPVSLFHQLRRGMRPPRGFEVRYWTTNELRSVAEEVDGEVSLSVDGFFGLGVGAARLGDVRPFLRPLVMFSRVLERAAKHVPGLVLVADSLFVTLGETRWAAGDEGRLP